LKWVLGWITQNSLLGLPENDPLGVPVGVGRLTYDAWWDSDDHMDVGFEFRCVRVGFDKDDLGWFVPGRERCDTMTFSEAEII
jgi:hypothetical protein